MTQLACMDPDFKPCGCVAAGIGPPTKDGTTIGDIWINQANPAQQEMYIWTGANGWKVLAGGGGGAGLPQATAIDQLLISGSAPNFPWELRSVLDSGRY